MPQIRIHSETGENEARTMQQRLEIVFEDAGLPVAAFEHLDRPGVWEISVYADESESETTSNQISDIAAELGIELKIEEEIIPDIDWVAHTLKELVPVRAGRFVLHGSHDMEAPKHNEIPIIMNAGLAFGTGHHGTTAGCLDMLDSVLKRTTFHNVLDVGTGSGVLAIAAAKILQRKVLATDIDPVAVETARDNCLLNGVNNLVRCETATGFNHRAISENAPYDLIMANILAGPLQKMSTEFSRNLIGGGFAILSGLLPHQRSSIIARYRQQGLVHRQSHIRDNWLTLVLQKP